MVSDVKSSGALVDHLLDRAMHPRVGFFGQPLLGELVEVSPAFERPVADEEMALDVPDHALVLALGPGSAGLADPGIEVIERRQIQEALVEPRLASDGMLQYRRLLVIHQHVLQYTTKVLQTANQALKGVFDVFPAS